ncbi:MAG TPA: prolyl oligopeptidase family serine peptidase [Candidatus Sulfotelmatobacter sp.]|jgi:dipeptidyl aminopeptidase/acylaminoacyl peptidase|nr:prolyl oligopeptidase family serine peptidase [Candidatus Sulfotelmatobacter sp.]
MMRAASVLRLRACLLGAAAFVVSSGALKAQSFTVEQILGAPFPSQLTAAETGSRAAWVFNVKGAQNLWVADGPRFEPRQVTHYTGDTGQPLASLRIAPDGKTLVYARGTEINGDGRAANPATETQQPKQQVWAIDVDGGRDPRLLGEMGCASEGCEDIQISPDGKWAVWATKQQLSIAPISGPGAAKQLTDLRGNINSPRWSPDGKRLAFSLGRKDHSFIVIADMKDDSLQALHYVAPSVDRDFAPHWSPDGNAIVYLKTNGFEAKRPLIPERLQPWSICIADARTYKARELWKSGNASRDSLPHFATESLQFAAGNRVIFDSEADGWNHLYSIAAGGGAATLLTPGEFDVEEVGLSGDKKTVLFSSNQNDVDRRHLWRVDAAGGAAPVALTAGETIEWGAVQTGDGKNILCLGSAATSPAQVYRVSSGGRELLAKNLLPADFPAAQLVVPQQVIFKSDDGLTIHGQLFVPKNAKQRNPALIFTHGGPSRQMLLGFHYMDYYHNAYAENQYLASLGFVVLSVNYRLGVMYGHDFRRPPHSVWRGASEYKDVLAGAKYLASLPNVDAHRIGLWGGSYGGFLTALGLARNSDIFSAGVDFHGVHDWSAFLPEWEEGATSAPDYQEAVKLAWESSPNSSVDKWKSPVLLIQGDDDRNVPESQTVDLVQRLREHNVPVQQIFIPDEIHDFLLWKTVVTCYKATAEFFQAHLSGGQ